MAERRLASFVELGELLPRGSEADLQAFGFAEPAFVLGFADAGLEVVAQVGQPGPLGWVGPQQRAPDAAVLVDAAGAVGPAAVAERDLAAGEVAEEFLPFLVGRQPVFPAGRSARRRARKARWPLMASSR
jgi:hypothetical protein